MLRGIDGTDLACLISAADCMAACYLGCHVIVDDVGDHGMPEWLSFCPLKVREIFPR